MIKTIALTTGALLLSTPHLVRASRDPHREQCYMHIKLDCPSHLVTTPAIRVPMGFEVHPDRMPASFPPNLGQQPKGGLERVQELYGYKEHPKHPQQVHHGEPLQPHELNATQTKWHPHHHHPTEEPELPLHLAPATHPSERHHIEHQTIVPSRTTHSHPLEHAIQHPKQHRHEELPGSRSQEDVHELLHLASSLDTNFASISPSRAVSQLVPDLLYSVGISPDIMAQFNRKDRQLFIDATVDVVNAFQKAKRKGTKGEELKEAVTELITFVNIRKCNQLDTHPFIQNNVFGQSIAHNLVCLLSDIEERGANNKVIRERLRKRRHGTAKMLALAHLLDPSDYSKYLHSSVTSSNLKSLYTAAVERLIGEMPPGMLHEIPEKHASHLERYKERQHGLKQVLIGYMEDGDYAKAQKMLSQPKHY